MARPFFHAFVLLLLFYYAPHAVEYCQVNADFGTSKSCAAGYWLRKSCSWNWDKNGTESVREWCRRGSFCQEPAAPRRHTASSRFILLIVHLYRFFWFNFIFLHSLATIFIVIIDNFLQDTIGTRELIFMSCSRLSNMPAFKRQTLVWQSMKSIEWYIK